MHSLCCCVSLRRNVNGLVEINYVKKLLIIITSYKRDISIKSTSVISTVTLTRFHGNNLVVLYIEKKYCPVSKCSNPVKSYPRIKLTFKCTGSVQKKYILKLLQKY